MRITTKEQLESILKENGWSRAGGSKHDKWSKNGKSVSIPRNRHHWSRMVSSRLHKEILEKS